MSTIPTISNFFANKSVFITGGTGFIGKVLIEKLLRSCPEIKFIYMLMRSKKNKTSEERLKSVTDLPLFDLLRSTNPDALKKIKTVDGDVSELNLGLSSEDQELLIRDVNIIFHVAASVRFDDSLTDAILMNTRGTREVVNLAFQLKNLDVLVHVSTTYCNTDRKVIDEMLYPPHADWRKSIEIAETVDRHVLNALTEKYIHPLPNTYTFTKSLAEHVVYDMCEGKIPAVIYRPSVVLPCNEEPIPGWIDSLNGPMGVTVGCGTGVVRVIYGKSDIVTDYVPVDMLVKGMIISAWKQKTHKDHQQRMTLSVYNGCSGELRPDNQIDNLNMCIDAMTTKTPFDKILWYPNYTFTQSFVIFYIKFILYQLIPAVFFDGILKLLGKKPLLVKLQRKIYVASLALFYFSRQDWKFFNKKCFNFEKQLLPSDTDSFQYKESEFDLTEYRPKIIEGVKKYLLKEDDDLEKSKKKLYRMWLASVVFNVLWYLGLFWLVFVKFNLVSKMVTVGNKFWEYLIEE